MVHSIHMKMKHERLSALADGIFAIVMTILVFEIRIPEFPGTISSYGLFRAIIDILPSFLSYLLSFSLLFTYWRAHHFIVSVYARNIDMWLTNINAIFFFFIGLVPFSSYLLGKYHTVQSAIFFFSGNIVLIGLSLLAMRLYIKYAPSIENEITSKTENDHAYTRLLFPVFCAFGASALSFWNTELSLIFLTIGILFNLLPSSTGWTFDVWHKVRGGNREEEIIA